jgi:uncharacterized protein
MIFKAMTASKLEFQLFVKPVGALCNLECSYCYYLSKQGINKGNAAPMTEELLEHYILQQLETPSDEPILFSWHGGEPTLAGLAFFQKAVAIQKFHNHGKKRIINGIQTNGINLNDEWCRFFAEENFLVGISIDGPEALHNKYRSSKSGDASFKKVMDGYNLLKKYPIHTEILCVVNAHNVNYPIEVYRFFKSLGTKYITFLPLVNQSNKSATGVTPDSVPASSFGDFLIMVFDEWQEQDIGTIQIQLFEEAFRLAFKLDHTLCIFKKTCGRVPVLEKNGDFFSCDHFVDENHLIGNIHNTTLFSLLNDPRQIAFGEKKFNSLPTWCLTCEVLEMCHGECPKNRFILTPEGEHGLNYLCEGYRKFFNHCTPFVNTLAEIIEFEK